MSDQPSNPQPTEADPLPTARQLRGKDATALADLAGIFDDLQFVLGCCERLLGELARGEQRDAVVLESLWVAALNSYARCFRTRDTGQALSVTDLGETGLKGDVVQWHQLLGRLRTYLVEDATNPREEFFVGASQLPSRSAQALKEAGGSTVEGIVVTSITRPQVDETTIRQTGRLALELSTLVDKRMRDRQEAAFRAARALTAAQFDKLDPIDVDWSVAQAAEAADDAAAPQSVPS